MKTPIAIIVLTLACAASAAAVPPLVAQWKMNTTGATGYGGYAADVTLVRYSATNVYVTAQGIPSYTIGPWNSPNSVVGLNWCFKLPLTQSPNTGTRTTVGLGHVAVMRDGSAIYSSRDARSYNNQGIWNQTAWVFERGSFDACYGHPSPGSEYHQHAAPICLIGGDSVSGKCTCLPTGDAEVDRCSSGAGSATFPNPIHLCGYSPDAGAYFFWPELALVQ
jgi:hypothetical protein